MKRKKIIERLQEVFTPPKKQQQERIRELISSKTTTFGKNAKGGQGGKGASIGEHVRITEEGEIRITENAEQRITENG